MAISDVHHGKLARVYRKVGTAYTQVANANDWTVNIIRETVEGRVFENDSVQRRVGLQDSNISLGGLMEATIGNGYLLGLMANHVTAGGTLTQASGTMFVRFFINNIGTVPVLQGSVVITDMAIAASIEGLPTYNVTAAAAGGLHWQRATGT